jgi:hypothetical protein
MGNLASQYNLHCTGAGHNVLLIQRNPGGMCRDIYGRKQLYPPMHNYAT